MNGGLIEDGCEIVSALGDCSNAVVLLLMDVGEKRAGRNGSDG